ncbi:adenosylcobinamide-GDP ribazoletransferase [Corynebacterium sp. NPDC060344]|uniref:adenosylcobinamide-GDP ribazoletransferase n=1 Tax=Corynebacterium sp. NPDC060344 TaxID=3347101 RepID=UPI00364A839C
MTTAISWLTVVPMRGAKTFDRITGRRAMAAAPIAGLIPGAVAVLVTICVSGAAWLLAASAHQTGGARAWFGGLSGTGAPDSAAFGSASGSGADPVGVNPAGADSAAVGLAGVVAGVGPAADPAGAVGLGGSWEAAAVAAATSPLLAAVIGVLIVCAAELVTRAMHVDGLADVADALGSYRDPEGAREILRAPDTGPMGAAAVSLTLLAQAAAMAMLAHGAATAMFPAPWILGAEFDGVRVTASLLVLALPFIIGRAAATTACHHSLPPMAPTGFGGLVAATQPTWALVAWWVPLTAVAGIAAGVAGALACLAALVFALGFGRLLVRRLGGINGDALGAIIQLATLIAAIALALAIG